MSSDKIDYPKLIDQAMQHIVKEALHITSKTSLPGNHHFFISFLTFHPKVIISHKLKKRYPEEMTIVLQHQFENLEVHNDYFSVSLSFDGIKEKIIIPYDALTAFADPSVKFGLQFKHLLDEELSDFSAQNESLRHPTDQISANIEETSVSNVVNLESFRNKY